MIVNAFFLYREFYWFSLLPFVLGIVYLAFWDANKLFYIIAFFAPISLNLEDVGGLGVYLPTEPLMAGLLVIFILRISSGFRLDKKQITNGITLTIIAQLIWMFITTLTSEMPLVSLKFWTSRLWLIIPFYFMGYYVFSDLKKMKTLLWAYIFPLCFVIIYAFVRLYQMGFDKEATHWVMDPFFKDHTSYGASLALFYPFVFYEFFRDNKTAFLKFFKGVLFVIMTIGVVFSYTRATWLSLVAALGVAILIWLKIKWYYLAIFAFIVFAPIWAMQDQILMKLEKNDQDSSEDLVEHVESMSNIATDASNLERLNRWNCAFAMFAERPIVGWGPGTYMFQYGAFQNSNDLTVISTNFGDLGNAHSEYFGPLSEQGLPGALLMILLVIVFCFVAINTYYKTENKQLKYFLLCIFLGLVTYFIHGVLNNYLDTDKAAIPVWGFLAMICLIAVKKDTLIEE